MLFRVLKSIRQLTASGALFCESLSTGFERVVWYLYTYKRRFLRKPFPSVIHFPLLQTLTQKLFTSILPLFTTPRSHLLFASLRQFFHYVYFTCSLTYYNIARVLPNLIAIGVIMVSFLNIRTAVRSSDDVCKSDGEAYAFYRGTTPQKMYIYKGLSKFNERLRLNRYEKPLSPLCFCTAAFRKFCN